MTLLGQLGFFLAYRRIAPDIWKLGAKLHCEELRREALRPCALWTVVGSGVAHFEMLVQLELRITKPPDPLVSLRDV